MTDNKIQLEDKVYTFPALLETGFDVDAYEWYDGEGCVEAILDCKCYGRRKLRGAIIGNFTLVDDGKKICIAIFKHNNGSENFFGLRDIPLGGKVRLTFVKSKKSGRSYIKDLQVI